MEKDLDFRGHYCGHHCGDLFCVSPTIHARFLMARQTSALSQFAAADKRSHVVPHEDSACATLDAEFNEFLCTEFNFVSWLCPSHVAANRLKAAPLFDGGVITNRHNDARLKLDGLLCLQRHGPGLQTLHLRPPARPSSRGLSQKDSDVAKPPERKDLYSALLRARHRNQSIETCVVLQMRQPADRCARGSSASRNMCTTAQRVACQLESSGIFRRPMKTQ
jgi:hypothetical protein